MNNIILIGFMGSGKTTVGKELAKALNFTFCDTDDMIEKETGELIKDIFAKKGEAYFRNLESKLINDLTGKVNHIVLSVGGGLPIQPGNAIALKKLGTVIYLSTSKESIKKRLAGDKTRPLLQGPDASIKLTKLYNDRTPIYKEVSHLEIITDDKSVQQIVMEIMNKLK